MTRLTPTQKNSPTGSDIPNTERTTNPTNPLKRWSQPLRSFIAGSYITRDQAQGAFDRQRQQDAIGDRVMLWFAVLGAVTLTGPTLISELAFTPLLVFFLVRTRNTFGTWVHWFGQPVFLLVLCWTAWQAVTLLWSQDPALGRGELGQGRWALLGVLVWPIIHKRRTILAALAVGFALAHLAQLVQLAGILNHDGTYDPVFNRDPRRVSGWWDPVVGGTLLVAAVGLHLPAAVFWRGRTRWIARAGLLAATLGVIATGSRGAWLAAAALIGGTTALALWRSLRPKPTPVQSTGSDAGCPRTRRRRWPVPAAWVAIAIGSTAALWFTAGPAIQSRVEQARAELRQAASGETDTDIGRRIDMAEWGARAIAERPIRGAGAGGFRAWVEARGGPFVFDHAHNAALHIGATTGLVGLAIWGLIVLVLIRNGVINRGSPGDPAGTSGPLFAILGLLLVSAFDVVHLNAQTAALFWLLAGVCVTWQPDPPADGPDPIR